MSVLLFRTQVTLFLTDVPMQTLSQTLKPVIHRIPETDRGNGETGCSDGDTMRKRELLYVYSLASFGCLFTSLQCSQIQWKSMFFVKPWKHRTVLYWCYCKDITSEYKCAQLSQFDITVQNEYNNISSEIRTSSYSPFCSYMSYTIWNWVSIIWLMHVVYSSTLCNYKVVSHIFVKIMLFTYSVFYVMWCFFLYLVWLILENKNI